MLISRGRWGNSVAEPFDTNMCILARNKTKNIIFKTPEAVLASIITQEGFEDTTIDDVKRYW